MVESINVIWVLLGSSKVGIRHNIELVTKRGMQEDMFLRPGNSWYMVILVIALGSLAE